MVDTLEVLVNLGMKEALAKQLDEDTRKLLIAYSMDHVGTPTVLQSLITLASMELQGKKGAAYLAALSLATPPQLKEITAEEMEGLVEEHKFYQDARTTIHEVKKLVVQKQQEIMFVKSGGMKGEYFIDPRDNSQEDDADI